MSKIERGAEIVELAEKLAKELEEIHGEPSLVVIAAERYAKITGIVSEVQKVVAQPQVKWERIFDYLTTHPAMGYVILGLVIVGMLSFVFYVGGLSSALIEESLSTTLIEALRSMLKSSLPPEAIGILVDGAVMGLVAGLTIVLPYIIPFYVILSLLEDSGYLPRAAYLTDNLMHKVGLHGKALIPLLLGFGCNVPACIGCRVLETERERCLCGLATVFVPCAARGIVILGVGGRFLGIAPALSIYSISMIVMLSITRLAYKVLPGEPIGLIMEMPPYRRPSIKSILAKTWGRTKEFIFIAFPIIIGASALLEGLRVLNMIEPVVEFVKPFTVGVLGLPPQAIVPLLFGFLRKELAVVMLADALGTMDFLQVMTPLQIYVFALVVAIYIPCVATLAALVKEFGWRRAVAISLTTIAIATLIGAAIHGIFSLISLR